MVSHEKPVHASQYMQASAASQCSCKQQASEAMSVTLAVMFVSLLFTLGKKAFLTSKAQSADQK